MAYRIPTLLVTFVLGAAARGQDPVPLVDPKDPARGWKFDNGREFPGATGSLTSDIDTARGGRAAFKLVGDFTGGGNYVQAGRPLDGVDVRELSLWVRTPTLDKFTVRLVDAGGQTHQIVLKTEARPGWQQVVFPLEQFFAKRGQTDAVPGVAKYESWGGAKDGVWHGPAKGIYLILGNPGGKQAHTIWFADLTIAPKPVAVPGAGVKTSIRLDEVAEGTHDWRFTRGEEFPGARGSLAVVPDEPAAGQTALKLAGDFTGGGAYVGMVKELRDLGVQDVTAVRLRARTETAAFVGVQMVDGAGQTHQRSKVPVVADGKWHDLELKPTEIAGGEHWGGPNDGKWHGPLTQLSITLPSKSDEKTKQPVVYLHDVRAEAVLPVFAQPAAFRADFEGTPKLPAGWTAEGDVAVDPKEGFKSSQSLVLSRTLEAVEKPSSVTGPAFAVAPGQWDVGLAYRADLHSPDNSYSAVVTLEVLDAGGKVLDRVTVADVFGKREWKVTRARVELPKGAATARFRAQLNKTYGRFALDDLSASYLAPAPRRDDRVSRLLFSTARLGNLLFPDDPRTVGVTVEAAKPLRDDQRTLTYVVRDYWGAEQTKPATATLTRATRKDGKVVYETTLDLTAAQLVVGRYYEVHGSIPRDGGEPFRSNTSLAVLPEAETKKYKAEDVPFTSRNWDNRLTEYIQLTDRLGIRTCGVWGSWSAKPPYKPEAPGLELCEKLGMRVLTNTPAATIERGEKEYTEESLRLGAKNFIDAYGKRGRVIVNLGNEPHGTGDRVRANVAAYKAVYEAVKAADPTITVVATSVEPNEEYFRAGYGKWCDAYDFHIYEEYPNVRRTMEEYRALMKKYGQEKPIWSTELGLNSQGMTRHVVAVELLKKSTTFFAAGGTNMSWFGLLYPDGDGKLAGSSGDAHNVFDCRFNRYCPRLDAVAYYNAVNGIGIKKFVAEKEYAGGIRAYLFRDKDGRCLQVLWTEKGRKDVFVPLAGVEGVQAIRIDGSRRVVDAGGKGVTLGITDDPLLLLYAGGDALPDGLGEPAAAVPSLPKALARRGPTTLTVTGRAEDLDLTAPPFWVVEKAAGAGGGVRFTLTPPAGTTAREADLTVTVHGPGGRRAGELYIRLPIGE
ncbi:MAG: hypothetical protein JWO38_4821 [Gemmataceae bacterium]|nr:hypothetical protein [Gemmataceae bacterium]